MWLPETRSGARWFGFAPARHCPRRGMSAGRWRIAARPVRSCARSGTTIGGPRAVPCRQAASRVRPSARLTNTAPRGPAAAALRTRARARSATGTSANTRPRPAPPRLIAAQPGSAAGRTEAGEVIPCTDGNACAPGYRCNAVSARADRQGCEPIPCDEGTTCPADRRCNPGSSGADTFGCELVPCDAGYTCPADNRCSVGSPRADGHGCEVPCGDGYACPENTRCTIAAPAVRDHGCDDHALQVRRRLRLRLLRERRVLRRPRDLPVPAGVVAAGLATEALQGAEQAGNWLVPTLSPFSTKGTPVSTSWAPLTSVTRKVYGPGPMPAAATK